MEPAIVPAEGPCSSDSQITGARGRMLQSNVTADASGSPLSEDSGQSAHTAPGHNNQEIGGE